MSIKKIPVIQNTGNPCTGGVIRPQVFPVERHKVEARGLLTKTSSPSTPKIKAGIKFDDHQHDMT